MDQRQLPEDFKDFINFLNGNEEYGTVEKLYF
jgi:hypothetical protein